MTVKRESRQVPRDVHVYCCDRCGAEATEDNVSEWMHLCRLEVRSMPTLSGTIERVMAAKPASEQHLCSRCADLVVAVLFDRPTLQHVGAALANIPVRTTSGETLMLTRFEYDRWAARGKPPVISAEEVKA